MRGVLIATPVVLWQLLLERSVSLRRLKHIVFEETDELLEKFQEEIDLFLRTVENMLTKRHALFAPVQLLMASQHWTSKIESLGLRLDKTPTVLIESHLEAAFYGGTRISVRFITVNTKLTLLTRFLEGFEPGNKVVIVCATTDDLQIIAKEFQKADILWKKANEKESLTNQPVFLCTDSMLSEGVNIKDADVVIHFSFPESWSSFCFRFSLSIDKYESVLDGRLRIDRTPSVIILVDESNKLQFPKLVSLIERMECNVPLPLQEVYGDMIVQKEKNKLATNVPLCTSLKSFGYCNTLVSCLGRHTINSTIDVSSEPNQLPVSGLVRLHILEVINPTTFSVRLIRHTDSNGELHDLDNIFSRISSLLLSVTSDEEILNSSSLKEGNMYAMSDADNAFYRCSVKKINSNNNTADVYLIDRGINRNNISVDNLRKVPPALLKIPPQCIFAHLTGIGPPNGEDAFTKFDQRKFAKKLYSSDIEKPNTFFVGRIQLQLSNCLWFEDLRLVLDSGYELLYKFSIRTTLLRLNIAKPRPEHLDMLYEICRNNGLSLPDYELPPAPPVLQPVPDHSEPSWAHLDSALDVDSYLPVYFCGFSQEDTNLIYLRLYRNDKILRDLIEDINVAITELLYPKRVCPAERYCYLAQDPVTKLYNRCQLREILPENKALVYFVDHGDEASILISELLPIRDDFIKRLPFQAIRCRLWGIHTIPSLQEKVEDYMYRLSEENGDSYDLRKMYIKKICRDDNAYKVLLFNLDDSECQLVNDRLVHDGLYEKDSDCGDTPPYDLQELIDLVTPQPESKHEPLYDHDSDVEEMATVNMEFEFTNNNQPTNFDCDSQNSDILKIIENCDIVHTENFFKHLFFPNLIGTKSTTNCINTPNELPPLELATNPGYNTPTVVWSQTLEHLTVNILLSDVQVYELRIVRSQYLHFCTTLKNIEYRLAFMLTSPVKSDIVHEARGAYIYAKISKKTPVEWSRLNAGRKRLRNLFYRFSDYEVDKDDNIVDVNDLKNAITHGRKFINGVEFCIHSSEEYSTSDINSDSEISDS